MRRIEAWGRILSQEMPFFFLEDAYKVGKQKPVINGVITGYSIYKWPRIYGLRFSYNRL